MTVWLLVFLCLLCSYSTVRAAEPTDFVTIEGILPQATIDSLLALPEVETVTSDAFYTVIMSNGVSLKLKLALLKTGLKFNIEQNPPLELHGTTGAWQLDRLDQVTALKNGVGNGQYNPPALGSNVPIYVLDTGVNLDHAEFGGRAQRASTWRDEAPCVGSHHGSWVASIAAGRHLGAAPNATVWDVKLAHGADCTIYVCDAVMALSWLLSNPPANVFVVVMSWSTSGSSASINTLCNQLSSMGAVLVAAAGNGASSIAPCQNSPVASGATIAVGAVDSTDRMASFSNYGSCITCFAGGVSIMGASSTSSTGIVVNDGTSASAPLVAGVAAVLIEREKLTSASTARTRILELALKSVVKAAPSGSPNLLANLARETLLGAPPSAPAPPPSPASPPAKAASTRVTLWNWVF